MPPRIVPKMAPAAAPLPASLVIPLIMAPPQPHHGLRPAIGHLEPVDPVLRLVAPRLALVHWRERLAERSQDRIRSAAGLGCNNQVRPGAVGPCSFLFLPLFRISLLSFLSLYLSESLHARMQL